MKETSWVQTAHFGQLIRLASVMQSMRKSLASIMLSCPVPCMIPRLQSYTASSAKGLAKYDQTGEELKK